MMLNRSETIKLIFMKALLTVLRVPVPEIRCALFYELSLRCLICFSTERGFASVNVQIIVADITKHAPDTRGLVIPRGAQENSSTLQSVG